MISENNKLEFKPIGEGFLVNTISANEHGIIEWNDKIEFSLSTFTMGLEWELMQNPVDFMTAINSEKKIKSEYLDFYHSVEGTMELMRNLTRESTVRVFNGQWFIEEGDINE